MFALLRDSRKRSLLIQVLLVAAFVVALAGLAYSTAVNLKARGIPIGFGFLVTPAGMPIAETFIPYSPDDPYWKAILVGLVNTLVVVVIVAILATVAGVVVGIGRLSANPLISGICRVWVEVARNTPLIVLLLFLYALWWQVLPPAREALNPLPGFYVSQRGLVAPRVSLDVDFQAVVATIVAAAALVVGAARVARRRQAATGRRPPLVPVALGLIAVGVGAAFVVGEIGVTIEWPEFRRLNFVGGVELTPELTTIVVGLTLYAAGFIGEIVRAGILAVGKGQWEAGRALGLSHGKILRLVVIPQALRVVVPPMTSQYINIVKNSTLAIAVGFQEFITVMQTTINQSAHAIEGVAIILGVYLLLNLALSALLNWFNRRIAIVER